MSRGMQQTANTMGTHAMQGVASVFRCTKSLKKTIFGQNAVTATDVMAEDTDIDETKHKAYLIGENARMCNPICVCISICVCVCMCLWLLQHLST